MITGLYVALRPTAVGIFAPSGTGFRISGEGLQVGYAFSRLGRSTSHPSKEDDVKFLLDMLDEMVGEKTDLDQLDANRRQIQQEWERLGY